MKNFIITVFFMLAVLSTRAQQQMAFPFQGGKDVMMEFFKTNVTLSPELMKKRASGTAIFKFTADQQGVIQKIIIYYADDYTITIPFIAALQKSTRKWIIPDNEKLHDFIISFSIDMLIPKGKTNALLQKETLSFYRSRKPILASNPVPLDMATLLPAITTNYTAGK